MTPQYYEMKIGKGTPSNPYETVYRKFTTRSCVLIPIEIDRLEYLISYCLKNYFIKRANEVADGKLIPKWRHEYDIKNAVIENTTPEVSVTVNGERYNII